MIFLGTERYGNMHDTSRKKIGPTVQPKLKSELVVRPRPCYAPECTSPLGLKRPKSELTSEWQTAKSSRSSRRIKILEFTYWVHHLHPVRLVHGWLVFYCSYSET